MSPLEKLGMMIAEEFVHQAQNQLADHILKSARNHQRKAQRQDLPHTRAAAAANRQ